MSSADRLPMLTPERWIKDFEQVQIRDEVRQLIMKENALSPETPLRARLG